MTEPKEFQGMQRAELVRLVVRCRELRKQAVSQCERAQKEREETRRKYDALAQWTTVAAQTLDELPRCVDEATRREIERIALGLVERLPSGTEVSYEECFNCAGVVVPCPDCGVTWAHGLGCPRR